MLNVIEQYKLLSVREDPTDNRQQHLDVVCFPTLYPIGKFGKYHPHEVKNTHTEFNKNHLLNKDSHFRKDPQYYFTYCSKKKCMSFLLVCTISYNSTIETST